MASTETERDAAHALDNLFRAHGARVYRYSLAVLGNHADAEDVTQTTFLSAYRALERGVRPRKPESWLLTIASNAIKQRYRQESARPRQVELDDEVAGVAPEEDGPTVGELLAALAKIPPQQRQAIVLREFEGRSYAEIAEILGVTHSALETLLFRARRSLAEELEAQLTCTEAQLAISRAADERLGRKERRRLREHLGECPDCARFARLQQRHRRALKGLLLLPVPVSLSLVRGIEGSAAAATVPATATAAATASTASVVAVGVGTVSTGTGAGAAGSSLFAGGLALKAAAVVSAAAVTGGVAVTGSTERVAPGRRAPVPTVQTPKATLGTVSSTARANGSARSAASTRGAERRLVERPPRATPPSHSRGDAAGTRSQGAGRAGAPAAATRSETRPRTNAGSSGPAATARSRARSETPAATARSKWPTRDPKATRGVSERRSAGRAQQRVRAGRDESGA
jgi:RNA polymerase sigma factor (sigma-70 family)